MTTATSAFTGAPSGRTEVSAKDRFSSNVVPDVVKLWHGPRPSGTRAVIRDVSVVQEYAADNSGSNVTRVLDVNERIDVNPQQV